MTTTSEEFATRIVRTLQQAGHLAYFAGGCVRDRLMGRVPVDFDIATSARPQEVLGIFPRSQKVGIAFGVVLVRHRQHTVEVATFRTDGTYLDGRHPTAVTFATAKEDAQRRDFTCNGLFYDPIADELHDFVGGQADIATRTLRAIGIPEQRFAEDHLRLLRAIRFAARLNFDIEPQTWRAICQLADKITTISRERIGEELRMILEHPSRAAAAAKMHSSGLLSALWPPPLLGGSPAWRRLAALSEKASRTVGLVAMQRDLALPQFAWSDVARLLRSAFMLSNQETDDLAYLGAKLDVLRSWRDLRLAGFKRLLADPRWPDLEVLWRAEAQGDDERTAFGQRVAVLRQEAIAPPPLVTGDDLIQLGVAPGPEFKGWLEQLYDRQLENEFADRQAALAAARRLIGS